MVFSCAPNFRAKAAAKKQALKQKLAGAGAYHGVSLRLLLVDRQVDAQDVLPNAALGCVHVVKYDAKETTLAQLVGLIREAHRQNGAPFLSMAIAQHGADAEGQWQWTTDLTVNLKSMHGAIDQLAPVVEVLAAALSKTKAGKAHIDLLACNLATTCKGLVPALEKMYGIDFRASTDETGNDLSGGDWKMETDNDYDVAADYLDADKLKEYMETMGLTSSSLAGGKKKGMTESLLRSTSTSSSDDIPHVTSFEMEGSAEASASAELSRGTLKLSARAELSASYQAGVATSGEGYDFSADFLAQAVANAKAAGNFSCDGVGASAELQLLVQADAAANGQFDTVAGSFAATAKAQAAVEAFAGAKAKLGKDGAMVSLGAHIGASVTAGVTFTYTSPSGALTITAALSVKAGVCLGGQFHAGVTCVGGAVTFAGKVDVAALAGGSIDLKVTIDVGKLKALIKVKIQQELEKLKPEESKHLLAPGFVQSDAYTVACEVEEVDVLALAAAAKALF